MCVYLKTTSAVIPFYPGREKVRVSIPLTFTDTLSDSQYPFLVRPSSTTRGDDSAVSR